MHATQNTGISFYQSLGKLFYAIAAADKTVHKSEYESLRKMVKSEWLQKNDIKDEFGTDASLQIEIVFDWMDYTNLSSAKCFEEFEIFYKENTTLFTDTIKELIWETSGAIANAFSGKNKSELVLLGKLQLLFHK